MLNLAASGGNIEMWITVVDILEEEGLLEEVHQNNLRSDRVRQFLVT